MEKDEEYNAQKFWERYGDLAEKDLPVILRTDIRQSTLSTWRSKNKFPRADMALKIARALNTTVEYLVSGEKEEKRERYSPWAAAIARQIESLNEAGKKIVFDVAKGLEAQYPLGDSSSTKMAT